jgi:hypothetical protein
VTLPRIDVQPRVCPGCLEIINDSAQHLGCAPVNRPKPPTNRVWPAETPADTPSARRAVAIRQVREALEQLRDLAEYFNAASPEAILESLEDRRIRRASFSRLQDLAIDLRALAQRSQVVRDE